MEPNEDPQYSEIHRRWLEPTSYYDNCAPDATTKEEAPPAACELHYPEFIPYCQPSCNTDCFNTPYDPDNPNVTMPLFEANVSAALVAAVEAFAGSNWSTADRNYTFLPWDYNVSEAEPCGPSSCLPHWSMVNITVADYNDMLFMGRNVTGHQCHLANYTGDGCHQTCVETCVEVCENYTIPVICNKTGGNPDWQPVNFDHFGWAMMTLFV